MASSIDETKPTATSALTADVRANFTAAKTEIEALQADKAALADLASTATDDGTKGFNLVSVPPVAGEIGIQNHAFAKNNVLRFIPVALHSTIRDATNTADLAAYIQNAINSVVTQGEIFFPRGTYLTTDIVLPTAIEVSIRGEGGSILKADTGTAVVLTITNDITRGGNRSLKDIMIDGNSIANVIGIKSGDTTSAMLYYLMENVFVKSCDVGIDLYTAMEHTLIHVACYQNTIGLKLRQDVTNGGGNANTFIHCAMQSNTVGVFYDGLSVYPMHNNGFINCLIQSNTLCGVAVFSAEGGVHFTTSHFEGNGTAGTTLAVGTRTVTKSSIQVSAAKLSLIDCGMSESVADPAILLQNGAAISLTNSYGYGLTSGTFISGSLSESVEFYGYHNGLGKMKCNVARWPDTFDSGSTWMGIGKVVVTPSPLVVNDYVASSPTVPLPANAIVATINADAGDSEMGMVSSVSYTAAVGSTSTNRVTIDALPTGIAIGDTVVVTMLVKADIVADMGFHITNGSYVVFPACPVDTKWRRLVMTFVATTANAVALYAFSSDTNAPTVKFAKIQSTIIPSGGDTDQIQEIISQGLFNNNQNEFFYTVAPTVGTWKVGDRVKNTAPSVDGNNMVAEGWICTVAGTPGTWVAQYTSTVSPAT